MITLSNLRGLSHARAQSIWTFGHTGNGQYSRHPVVPRARLEEIAADITTKKEHIAQDFIEIGRLLIEAKSQTDKGHGKWLPWLKEIDIHPRTAQLYMEVARAYPNANLISHLGVTKARALLTLPEAQREHFITEPHKVNGKSKKVEEMSIRELKDTIQAKKKTGIKPVRNDDIPKLKNKRFNKFECDLKAVQSRLKIMKEFLEKYSNDPSLEKFADDLSSISEYAHSLFSLIAPKTPTD